jgi:hypothetical protein
MGDSYVKIGTKLDETGVDKGLVSLDKKLKTAGKATDGTGKAFGAMALKMAGAAAAIKIVGDVVSDLSDAYKKQEKAETQLEAAAKNNPYLTDSSVVQLKAYASELQGLSTTGDEELLPFMASLAAAGRTQDEIMQIMSASLDMAASGAFSLDGAVRNLNKSYGGLSGELGESIPEIKALTSEQLKNGAATKLMAERYKGIAAETAKATGTQEQLNNAIGDLKEEFGAGFEKGIAPIRLFFTELIGGWASAKRATREYEEQTTAARSGGKATEYGATGAAQEILETISLLDSQIAKTRQAKAELELAGVDVKKYNADLERRIALLKQEYDAMKSAAITARYKGEEEDKEAARLAKQKTDNKALSDYIAQATAARDKAIQAIQLKAQAEGVEADEMAILDANMSAYVSLISESNGLVTTSSAIAKDWLGIVQEQGAAIKDKNRLLEESAKLQDQLDAAMSAISSVDDRAESVKMTEQLANLDELYRQTITNEQVTMDDKIRIQNEYATARKKLEKGITKAEEEENAKRIENMLSIVNDFASQYQTTMASISELGTQMIEDEAAIKTAEIEEQYENGEISAEEYEAALEKIDKEAAEKQYKLDMWSWSADLLSGIANTALGATNALAQGGPYLGPALAAMITAAGLAQVATIVANKPVPPSYATGGIVPGTSYTGDKVPALVNSGEMILNASQQRNLFDKINSGGGGANVNVYNNAANDVNAKATVTEDGIKVVINRTVAKSMADGKYNTSYRTMQNNFNGVRLNN